MLGFKKKRDEEVPRAEGNTAWIRLLEATKPEMTYPAKLDALLSAFDAFVGLDAYYLYLLDPSGKRFILAHTKEKGGPAPEEGRGEMDFISGLGEADALETVQTISLSPILDFPFQPSHNEYHVASTRAGNMYAAPLRREGRTVGLLQMGPIEGRQAPAKLRRQVEELIFPLSFSVVQARDIENVQERLRLLESRSEVSRRLLSSTLELDRFIDLLLGLALTATHTEAGFVAVADSESGQLTIRAEAEMPKKFLEEVDLSPDTGLFEMLPGLPSLSLRDIEFIQAMGVKNILGVPLADNGGLLGIFALVNFKEGGTFADYSLGLLSNFSDQIKLVLGNERLLRRFTEQYLDTLKALAKSVDLRYPETVGHTEQVTAVATAIARQMKLSPHEVGIVETAAEVHNVGMCGIVEVSRGFQADYNYPTLGAEMVRILALPPGIADAVATHREWFDGWGYPNGLKGEEISLGGRILGLAKYFVESTSGREVTSPLSWTKLNKELELRQGSQFAPDVVAALLAILNVLYRQATAEGAEPCLEVKIPVGGEDTGRPRLCFHLRPSGTPCQEHGDSQCQYCFCFLEWEPVS
jgi:HD-GYP domain-containing protein (c-di-GMP phosphodiesterase class II)